jgi:hypothetical protein
MLYRYRFAAVAAALITVGALLGSRTSTADSAVSSPGISVEFSVEPVDAARTQFICRARVTELSSGVTLAVINHHVIPPRSMTGSITHESGERVVFTASVGEGGGSASYVVEYLKSGSLVAKQQGTISLSSVARPAAGV